MTVRLTTLNNGLRVVTHDMPAVETASVGVWVGAGTRNETPDVNGVAHLLEHMAFKGTETRSATDIAEQIEAVGGHLNAYTGPRKHGLLRQGDEGGCRRWRSTSSPIFCSTRLSMKRSCGANAPSSCRRSARRTIRPTT